MPGGNLVTLVTLKSMTPARQALSCAGTAGRNNASYQCHSLLRRITVFIQNNSKTPFDLVENSFFFGETKEWLCISRPSSSYPKGLEKTTAISDSSVDAQAGLSVSLKCLMEMPESDLLITFKIGKLLLNFEDNSLGHT